ncbi:MAG: hypothetical protein JRN59_03835 [Nitrososphaerota archaeon]|nr:hypothetical protein [Nitrososphaerota archaeon]
MDKGYSLNFLDWIKTRIAVTRTEDEDRSKFVIRELVQNADDAGATILVLRFEKDALYIANNGRAFTTIGPKGSYEGCDFDRSSRVLKRFKEYDLESTGHFGSGFQTVYAITNHPEVHSNVVSRALNPLSMEWNNLEGHLHSPYAGSKDEKAKGVLFRLPWRDETAAKEVIGARERPFAAKDFPRWGPEDVRSFYNDLKGYLCDVLLCCQRLKAIRIVWNADNRPEAYQAERDFGLNMPLEKARVVEVKQGLAASGKTWYRWDPHEAVEIGTCPPSFDSNGWDYQTPDAKRYFAASASVKDDEGKALFLLRGSRGVIRIDLKKGPTDLPIKKNHVHILFPLFPARKQYLYSVIPLPSRGRNRFAFSAHLFPVENRTGVDIQGNDEVNGEWYRECMRSIARLYKDTFPAFLASVRSLGQMPAEAEALVLQSLPIGEIREWMRPDKEDISWGVEEGKELRDWLFGQPILVTGDGTWHPPRQSYYVSNEVERRVVELLGKAAMPAAFTSKFDEIHWLKDRAEAVSFGVQHFVDAWKVLETKGPLRYGRTTGANSVRLDRPNTESVLRYALTAKGGEALRGLSLVPDAEGTFRTMGSFPRLPSELSELDSILSPTRRIHPEIQRVITELERDGSWRHDVAFNEVPQWIDTEFHDDPQRFEDIKDEDYRLISRLVFKVVTHESWALDKAIGKSFVPFVLDGVRTLGPPPDVRDHRGHEGENYRREWIFVMPFAVPGLTAEMQRKIRIFDLKGYSDSDKRRVASRLDIVALAEKPGDPTNFVRSFISPRLGSLFEHKMLRDFLGVEKEEVLKAQKKAMLAAIQVYFDKKKTERGVEPDDMAKVPCLYDPKGDWYPAGRMARGAGPILASLGLHQLSPDFDSERWKNSTLEALGAVVQLDLAKVVQIIKGLSRERPPDRRLLSNIFGTLLVEYDSNQLESIRGGLAEVDWVPVGITGVAQPGLAMLPTPEKVSILGQTNASYVDLDEMDDDVRAKVEALGDKGGAKAMYLGLAISPSLGQMTEVYSKCAANGREPPGSLLVGLSASLRKLPLKERERWRSALAKPAMYWGERWYDGAKVRIVAKPEAFPVPPDSIGLLVLSPDEASPLRDLLDALGATSRMQTVDLLDALVLMSDKARSDGSSWPRSRASYEAIWKVLDSHSEEVPPEAKELFGEKRVVFVAGSWLRPGDVLLDDGGVIDQPVSLGAWAVIPMTTGAQSASERLGALRVSRLDGDATRRFLRMLVKGMAVDSQQTEAVLVLLSIAEDKGWAVAMDAVPWPVGESNSISLKMPVEAFVGNQSLVKLFPSIPQAITTVNGRHQGSLRSLATRWKARPLDGVSYPDLPQRPEARANDIEAIMNEVYTRVVAFNSGDLDALSWMHGIEVWKVPKAIQRYSLGDHHGPFSVPSVVPLGRGRLALLLRDGMEGLDESGARALVSWAVGEGLGPDREQGMAPMLSQLYKDREEALDYDYAVERQRHGYGETLQRLASWYHACQLCGDVTPKDDKGYETAENIRSIISNRGGLFQGKFDAYEPANSLYLCPRHAILLQRGLVRFQFTKDWQRNKIAVSGSLRDAHRKVPEGDMMWHFDDVEVYEWNYDNPLDKKEDWNARSLKVTPDHAKAILERLIKHVENSK